jgi:hypothetical protein
MSFRSAQGTAQAVTATRAGAERDARLAAANINPATGLASDYLNHFNEAIMLLDMLPLCPECRDDVLSWQPRSYREHFLNSGLSSGQLAIAAYEEADPELRAALEAVSDMMTALLVRARTLLADGLAPDMAAALGCRTAAELKPLVARAGALINGDANAAEVAGPQTMVDGLLQR